MESINLKQQQTEEHRVCYVEDLVREQKEEKLTSSGVFVCVSAETNHHKLHTAK